MNIIFDSAERGQLLEYIRRLESRLATEREAVGILKKALAYYANDPSRDESKYLMIRSDFRSWHPAKDALARVEKLENTKPGQTVCAHGKSESEQCMKCFGGFRGGSFGGQE